MYLMGKKNQTFQKLELFNFIINFKYISAALFYGKKNIFFY